MDGIKSLLNRPKYYNNIDGVGELAGGVGALGFGLLMWLQWHAPKGSVWHGYAGFICMLALIAIIQYGPKAIKQRVTYPRTGFVEYRKRDWVWTQVAGGVLGALIVVGIGVGARRQWDASALGWLFGVALAASYAYHFARTVPWKLAVAGAMALGSLATAFLPGSFLAVVAGDSWAFHPVRTKLTATYLLCMSLGGVLLLISGGVSFWLYLRRTSEPGVEER